MIPCYKDMNPYDFPDELKVMQSQDCSKLGYMQDLTRGIAKILNPSGETINRVTTVVEENADTVLRNAYIFLKDGNYSVANAYFDDALRIEPNNSQALLGKLFVEQNVKSKEELRARKKTFENSEFYKKIAESSDDILATELNQINNEIIEQKNAIIKRTKKYIKEIAIITGVVCVCICIYIAFFILATKVIIPTIKYNKALSLYNEGEYNEAISAFEELDGYKDSAEQIEKCNTAIKDEKYVAAVALYNTKKYTEAISAFEALDGYKDSAKKIQGIKSSLEYMKVAKVGDIILFGSYEQDNDTSNGKEDIEWRVLAKEDNRILIISEYALDCRPYNTSDTDVTWETCSLRKWLNGAFLNNAFSADEQAKIQNTTVSPDENPVISTDPGNATNDKVFLLSITEVNKYFSSDEARKCVPTEYAFEEGAYTDSDYTKGGKATWWWLRSPGFVQDCAAFVTDFGSVYYEGDSVDRDDVCVRPALWINLDS